MVARKSVLRKGQIAPDFVLKDQEGKDLKLSDLRGRRVLLSFHPLAWTRVCAQQMQSLEENADVFESLNTVPLGISVDTVPSKRAWASYLGIKKVRLLSDFWPHGYVAKLYHLFREKEGSSARANVILDESGKVVFSKVYPTSEVPDIQEIIDVIKSL